MLVLAPIAAHAGKHVMCNYSSRRSRGGCRAELWASLLAGSSADNVRLLVCKGGQVMPEFMAACEITSMLQWMVILFVLAYAMFCWHDDASTRWLHAKVMDRQMLHRSDSKSPVSWMTRVWELDGGNSLWVVVIISELNSVSNFPSSTHNFLVEVLVACSLRRAARRTAWYSLESDSLPPIASRSYFNGCGQAPLDASAPLIFVRCTCNTPLVISYPGLVPRHHLSMRIVDFVSTNVL